MTVLATAPRNDSIVTAGDVGSTVRDFDFEIFAKEDLQVSFELAGVITGPLTVDVDYTVTGVGNESGGQITLIGAYSGGLVLDQKWSLVRKIVKSRVTDFTTAGPYLAATINNQLDRVFGVLQELEESVNRRIGFQDTVPDLGALSALLNLTVDQRKSQYLGFNSLGDIIVNAITTTGTIAGVDETDTDTVKNKAVSNNLLKLLEDFRTLLTTKGDIIGYSTGKARLPVGADNTVLTADSAEALGIKWAAQSADKVIVNKLINGNFDIWQRGTSFTAVANGDYTADRWQYVDGAGVGVVTINKSTTVPDGNSVNSLHVDVTTLDNSLAAGDYYFLQQKIEGLNCIDLGFGAAAAKSVTISFWIRSPKSGTHCVAILNSAINRSYIAEFTVAAADTFEQIEITIPGDTAGTWLKDTGLGLSFVFPLGAGTGKQGTAGAWAATDNFSTASAVNLMDSTANNIYISRVQLEKGTVKSDFEYRHYGLELHLSRRYGRPVHSGAVDIQAGGTAAVIDIPHPGMRTVPTPTASAVLKILSVGTTFTQSTAHIALNGTGDKDGGRYLLNNFTGMTSGNTGVFMNEGGEIFLDAEL